jgi:hypothetical protein
MEQAENKWLNILEDELKKEMDKAPSVVSSHDIYCHARTSLSRYVKKTPDVGYLCGMFCELI